MTIALHTCCGPCLIEPLDSLSAEDEVIVVFANPNIAPAEEYERRRDALRDYARRTGAKLVELPYEPSVWEEAVAGLEDSGAERCAACYRVRLGMTAKWAAEHGAQALATTLTVSPYQDHAALALAGEEVAASAGIEYLDRDFRDRYPSARARARELDLYRQNYCGCVYSKREADESRARRRAERQARRQAAVREADAVDG